MGYALHILLALATLAVPELGWGSDAPRPWGVVALLCVPHGLGWLVRRQLGRGRLRPAALLERVLGISPVLVQVGAVVAAGWLASVERWTGWRVDFAGWPGISLLLGLAPFVAAQLLAIDARARLFGRRAHAAVRSFHARLFASALLPFALYLGCSSLIALHEPLRVQLEEVSLHGALFSGVLLLLFAAGLPTMLRSTWDTAPIAVGGTRRMLERLAREARFGCRELLVWRTGNQVANAAIVGFTPRSRIVLFSDALLAQLAPREVAAVFAHEIGHAKRHHAIVFASWALALFLGADLLLQWVDVESSGLAAGIFAAVLVGWYVAFGFVSRRFELEADLTSLELLGESASLVNALEEVSGPHGGRRSTWRHFGTDERIAFLERAERDPAVGRTLRRRLRRVSRLGVALLVVVAALELHRLWEARGEERLVADLRLGRYTAAAARLADANEAGASPVDERLAALVERGVSLPPDDRSPAALEALALAAVEDGRPQEAAALLDLAVLRGRDDLEPALAALWARIEGTAPDPRAELPEAWRAALGDQ